MLSVLLYACVCVSVCIVRWITGCFRWTKNTCAVIHFNFFPAHTPSLPVRRHSSAPTSSLSFHEILRLCQWLCKLPNKELTPHMEKHDGGGGSGRRRQRMVRRRKGVAGGRRKGGELRAVESGTLCSSLCYAPALLLPQHPHLHPCSPTARPLLSSGLAGMLTFTRTHPLNISHPPSLAKQGDVRGKLSSLLQAEYKS